MKPPECSICYKDFLPSEGGLIYFAEDENDRKYNERLRQPGFVGHPSNAFWFCKEHYGEALKACHLNKKDALHILREIFK